MRKLKDPMPKGWGVVVNPTEKLALAYADLLEEHFHKNHDCSGWDGFRVDAPPSEEVRKRAEEILAKRGLIAEFRVTEECSEYHLRKAN